jgi:hypothetical protein
MQHAEKDDTMMAETKSQPAGNGQARSGANNPIDVNANNTVGALFLGIVSLVLLVAFLREEARNRALMARLVQRV